MKIKRSLTESETETIDSLLEDVKTGVFDFNYNLRNNHYKEAYQELSCMKYLLEDIQEVLERAVKKRKKS